MTLLVCSFTIIIFLNNKLTLIPSLLFDCKHLGQRSKDRGITTARTDLDLLSTIGIHCCLCGGGGDYNTVSKNYNNYLHNQHNQL